MESATAGFSKSKDSMGARGAFCRGGHWGLILGSAAAMLAFLSLPARGGSVMFTFRGQIASINEGADSLTSFKAGDHFALVLDFTPGGVTPAVGYSLVAGDVGVNPELAHDAAGFGPPFVDTDFKNPVDFQRFDKADISLAGSVLNFSMTDEDIGPAGRVTVGPNFPANWITDISQPLPGGVSAIQFSANGQMDFNILGLGFSHFTGDITEGEVMTTIPVPRAIWPGLAGIAGVILLRRRTMRR